MANKIDILCIGAVLWDVIGRRDGPMVAGDDRPGRITRAPGGVALNVAMALRRAGLCPALLSAVGEDAEGTALLAECAQMGLDTSYVLRSPTTPTDAYMAIEANGCLIAAIADARGLELAGDRILDALADGRLGTKEAPYPGPIALDGNLTTDLLARLAASPLFRAADLRLAPASPGKAERLRPLLARPRTTLYVNLEEAGLIIGKPTEDAMDAARHLQSIGVDRAVVTHGGARAAAIDGSALITAQPPAVQVRRVTGAGDALMAAHIAAELRGLAGEDALRAALDVAAAHVAGEV